MKKLVPAMEKIDKIFNYLYLKEKASQAEISKDLNIPKATTNRLLYTLVTMGYLYLVGKEYTLGNKFDYFSNKNKNYNLIKNISYPYLEELSLKFKETFKVSVFDKNKIRVIASVESNDYYKITVPENAIFPLHAGAASKILICQLTEKKLNSLLPESLPKYTENTITSREELKKELFKVNIKKIAFDNMEHSNTISAVAIPIFDKNNKIIAALSCPFFSTEANKEHIDEIVIAMKEVCKKISVTITNMTY
ncbi:IclR family transcriptional regulator [Cetobacterium somerae]|uniref:IclR family transcriptional regulator n=1 Tax=Cetobacterium sp. NK01 TaxID=2993530 RepID=UPI0021161EEE|nr:IclR family transcriptional regulator [Cetobacterium sp. NK01]MCQ8212010.1 IclR family transcriptional regulator [Cetobacterium sp. NK01]